MKTLEVTVLLMSLPNKLLNEQTSEDRLSQKFATVLLHEMAKIL